MAVWAQVTIAAAAILLAGAIAWGQLSAQQSSDHDLLLEIRNDVKKINSELHRLNGQVSLNDYRLSQLEEE